MPENFPWMWFIEQPLTYSKKTITATKKGHGSVSLCKCMWVGTEVGFFFPKGFCHQLHSANQMQYAALVTHCTRFVQHSTQGDVELTCVPQCSKSEE